MGQPAPYNRITSFTNFQAANPTASPNGSDLDAEYNAVKTTTDQILQNLKLIQRDDGALANQTVGPDQLSPQVSIGFNPPQPWAPSTAYTSSPQSTVFFQSQFFGCTTSHTSTASFDSTKWRLIADFSTIVIASASAVAIVPAGGVTKTNVQAAIYDLDTGKSNVGHTHPATDISDSTAAGRALLTAASVAAQLVALGLVPIRPGYLQKTAEVVPAGLGTDWLWCDGSSLLRATWPNLFAAISIATTGNTTNASAVVPNIPDTSNMRAGMPITGTNISNGTTILTVDSATQITMSANATGTTTSGAINVCPWGAADATHFNVPDFRGALDAGRDDMNGSARNFITVAGSSIAGTRIGAKGGAQNVGLSTANVPALSLKYNTVQVQSGTGVTVTQNIDSSGATTSNPAVNSGSTNAAVTVMPPVNICNVIIKT
jgi:hypothetical protein